MAKKTEAKEQPCAVDFAGIASAIKEYCAADAEANAQVADHYNVVLHHLAALESAIESYRKSKGGE